MVETLVILFVTLLLLLGIIQFGLIYNAKTILNYATFEATRAGTLNHADRQAIEYGLAIGLAPLYASVEKQPGGQSIWDKIKGRVQDVEAIKKARNRVQQDLKDFTCIERINPTSAAFSAYGIKGSLGSYDDQRLIPNDHLLYRSAVIKGGAQVSIQDANLLKLRITYCYPMAVPMISKVIKQLYGLTQPGTGKTPLPAGSFRQHCLKHDRMPIVAQATLRMQTAARNDKFADSCL